MIKLDGAFEIDGYWREVRQTGNDRLMEFGLEDWVVTLRPPTVADSDGADARERDPAVNMSAATKMLDIAVDGQPDLPPQSFVQASIIDVIAQAIDSRPTNRLVTSAVLGRDMVIRLLDDRPEVLADTKYPNPFKNEKIDSVGWVPVSMQFLHHY